MPSGMFLIFNLRLFLPALSCSRRGVLLLAAALRQHVLPPGSSAPLHEPADDERLFESEGKYTQAFNFPVASSVSLSLLFFSPLRCTERHRVPLSSSPQQLGADPQSWTEVFAVLKGTSLFCYHRQEDVEANVEPAFTIAVNKVREGSVRGGLRVAKGGRVGLKVLFYF